MELQVIYFSRKGSTKKIAEAIASEIGVKAEDVKTAKLKNNELLFLGSGCYGSKPGKDMIDFIEENNFKSKNVALFGTSGGGLGQEVIEMEKILNSKGAKTKGKYYCKGKLFLINRKKPDRIDIDNAKRFAKEMIN
jgi:flavodoxin I